jgi:sRNA-binding carbon storage regulator CsrA
VIVDGFNSAERALKVTVLEIKNGRVRLGFEVNKDIPVQRAALSERIHARDSPSRPIGGA